MTKEQAIKVLNTYYRGEDNDDREFCDAIEMAIKALEQQPSDDVMAIHTQGLADGIRCAMCTNSMKSDRGCDGGCVVDEDMYKKVMETINTNWCPLVKIEERKVGKWIMPDEYYDKNIWRKCSVCNTHFEKYHKYVTFSGEVTYTEEIANYCKVCGAEMRGNENE